MQFPESWLREFCNPPLSTQQLAETLTMGGLEVEEQRPTAPPFTKIVVGEIKEAVQHPDADRLRRAERPRRHQGAVRAGRCRIAAR
jgi:phenylalanyl-tRNA synthetase beta chain